MTEKIYCSGGLYAVQGGYMLFRGVICCSGGLYGCSGGLYTVQGGYMMFRGVICCSGGLYAVQEGYMLKKIMMILVATNVVASRPTGTPTARAKMIPKEASSFL